MKRELNLTKEEKIDFLVNLECFKGVHNDNGYKDVTKKEIIAFISSMVFFASAGIVLLALNNSLAMLMMAFMVGCAPVFVGVLHFRDMKAFKKFSNNKITYKKYKQLVKSGEIEKWKNEYKKEIENKKLEILGITQEEYTREIEDIVINELTNKIKDENVSLDYNRITEEVKKRIDEQNER